MRKLVFGAVHAEVSMSLNQLALTLKVRQSFTIICLPA